MALTFIFKNINHTLTEEESQNNVIDLTPILGSYVIDNIEIGNTLVPIENNLDLTPALDAAIDQYLNDKLNPKYLKIQNKVFPFNNGPEVLDITNPIINVIKDQTKEE